MNEEITTSRISAFVSARVNPEMDTQVTAFYGEALKAKEYAEARVIAKVDDLKPATEDLSLIAKLKKALEDKRKEYVKPLQDNVKSINDSFKNLMEPIDAADRITREKILAFNLRQKLIREELEKVNALRMEAARMEMEVKGELTESVDLVEVIPEAPKKTITELGSSSTFKVRKWEITDFSQVPDEYKIIDAGKVTKLVKAGIGSIHGIRIWEEDSLRVNTR